MAAELGQTTNPKDLIPGDPTNISTDLRKITGNLTAMDGVGGKLAKVDPGQWTGQASQLFRDTFGKEPPKWTGAVDRLGSGGQQLANYADQLNIGQRDAQRAIELYTKAQAASRLAAAQHAVQQGLAAAGGAMLPAPFKDPGAPLMREARAILEQARDGVRTTGDMVESLLNFTDDKGKSTVKSSIMDLDKKFGVMNSDDPSHGRTWGGKTGYGSDPNSNEKFLADRVGIKGPEKELVGAKTGVSMLDGELKGSFGDGAAGGSGNLKGSLLGADAGANVTAGPTGVTAGANADAYLAKGSADGELHAGPGKLKGHGEAIVGAEANGKVHAGPLGGEASGGAFAGGKVKGDADATIGGVGAGVNGEARAGIGVDGGAKLGLGDDGKFHAGASVGAALGVGGKVGFDVAVDPKDVTDTAKSAASHVGDAASGAAHAAGGAAHAVGSGAKTVGHALGF